MAALQQYSWLIAIISIAFCFSSFGNGGNDVANAYATSIAARTLKMWQAGILSIVTEFVGAVALGSGVTSTIKNKIMDLDQLAGTLESVRAEGQTVVHCHGVFDLLHIGHIKHFEEAKLLGDLLVVTVTPDAHVNKGPNRPAFNSGLRLQSLASLETVDYVAENKWPTAIETIKMLKPNIYCKGPDFKNHPDDITGKIVEEEKAVKLVGGDIRYTSDITFSSSNLLNRFTEVFSKTQKSFIESQFKYVHPS